MRVSKGNDANIGHSAVAAHSVEPFYQRVEYNAKIR